MKYFFQCCLLVIVTLTSLGLQQVNAQTVKAENNDRNQYISLFNWKITIPDNYTVMDNKDWGKTYMEKNSWIKDSTQLSSQTLPVPVLAFTYGPYNYFEANYQYFNDTTALQQKFKDVIAADNEQLYKTFKTQLPKAQIDSASSVQYINGLLFQRYTLIIKLENNMTVRSYMYSHLFGNRKFSANILYVKQEEGVKMINAWLNSTFN